MSISDGLLSQFGFEIGATRSLLLDQFGGFGVEVAFVDEMPSAVAPILSPESVVGEPRKARCAVFYSITSCQAGLKGISFGNFLIKQVVEEISRELPNLKIFVTLSPVPGFRAWLEAERRAERALHAAECDKRGGDEQGAERDLGAEKQIAQYTKDLASIDAQLADAGLYQRDPARAQKLSIERGMLAKLLRALPNAWFDRLLAGRPRKRAMRSWCSSSLKNDSLLATMTRSGTR